MTSIFSPSILLPLAQLPTLTDLAQRQQLRHHLAACRDSTLRLVDALTPAEYRQQAHDDFSPVGWHLGHIALTEAQWLLPPEATLNNPLSPYQELFAADGLPKAARQQLPELALVLDGLRAVREQVWDYLALVPLDQHLRLWAWLLQHESQHAETISIVLALHRRQRGEYLLSSPSVGQENGAAPIPSAAKASPMVWMPAAAVTLGYEEVGSLDNEQPSHPVVVESFWLDAHPVTQAAFREFMVAGGYDTEVHWSPQGWAWRQKTQVSQPLYWPGNARLDDHPVCGVSYYEAEAYANFVGKRLPMEAEWERAAGWSATGQYRGLYPWGQSWPNAAHGNFGGEMGMTCPVGHHPAGHTDAGVMDLLGNVWEWTATWFEGYPGFRPFPYRGYSQTYFDGQHRVLRGGSWATRSWGLRGTLRNWYYPQVREIFAGFRCARSG